jgi:hypothetical protein
MRPDKVWCTPHWHGVQQPKHELTVTSTHCQNEECCNVQWNVFHHHIHKGWRLATHQSTGGRYKSRCITMLTVHPTLVLRLWICGCTPPLTPFYMAWYKYLISRDSNRQRNSNLWHTLRSGPWRKYWSVLKRIYTRNLLKNQPNRSQQLLVCVHFWTVSYLQMDTHSVAPVWNTF